MFLKQFIQPRVVFNKGGGGGGGGSSKGRNRDADNFAGSSYAPTKNAGTSKASQVTYSNDTRRSDRTPSKVTGSTTNFNSKSSVTAKDLADGNVSKYNAKSGTGSLTVSQGTTLDQAPTVNVGVNGNPTSPNSDVYNDKDVATPTNKTPVTGGGDGGGGSIISVAAQSTQTIDPKNGVGGGRDGGKGRKSKSSKTNEDKIAVKRKSAGVSRYRTAGISKKARANPMTINKRA